MKKKNHWLIWQNYVWISHSWLETSALVALKWPRFHIIHWEILTVLSCSVKTKLPMWYCLMCDTLNWISCISNINHKTKDRNQLIIQQGPIFQWLYDLTCLTFSQDLWLFIQGEETIEFCGKPPKESENSWFRGIIKFSCSNIFIQHHG